MACRSGGKPNHRDKMNPTPVPDDDSTLMGPASQPPISKSVAAPANPSSNNTLPIGTRLGEFQITGLIGQGGFGIVYLANDFSLDRVVAIKEYMPAAFATRTGNITVSMMSAQHAETFQLGLRSFVNEAHMLARFDHPSLVKVYRFWEANGTAYMAMPYHDANNLKVELRQRNAPPDEAWLKDFLRQILEALDVIHEKQCFHRDIAPDNILMLDGKRPMLLDFGAARRVISDMTHALTVILKPGYAPIEQYGDLPGMSQGAWTDIYALASVIYFSITGKVPPAAVVRIISDHLQPLASTMAGRYSDKFLRAIDAALAIRPENRPQSVAQFRELLGLNEVFAAAPALADPDLPTIPRPKQVAAPKPAPAPVQAQKTPSPPLAPTKSRRAIYALAGFALLAGLAGAFLLSRNMADPGATLPAKPSASALAGNGVAQPATSSAASAAGMPVIANCPIRGADGAPLCPQMVDIAGGVFRIGSQPGELGAAAEEYGAHQVKLAGFRISAHEISVEQWSACVGEGACPERSEGKTLSGKLPMTNVSWDDTKVYMAWITRKIGVQFQLPSEAQWEYAARAGATTPFPWGDKVGTDHAHCGQCGSHLDFRSAAPVGSYKPNWGLYDMAGNVHEWVEDCWYPKHDEAQVNGDARSGVECNKKVQKGGAYDSTESDVRPAARTFDNRAAHDARVGFRVLIAN